MHTSVGRPHMLVCEFEELARCAYRTAEKLRLEFLGGRLGVKPRPDGNHSEMFAWLYRLCWEHRPELGLYALRGLEVEAHGEGRVCPAGVLAELESFVGDGDWSDPGPVPMAVEVTAYDADADRRDRMDKPRAYAETGIPVHLLIDRDSCELKVFSQPDGIRYERVQITPFGKEAHLPDPVDLTLDTEPLKNWVS
ncbi:Uma2 family endonuclease [Streptomyces sclerotialus]|uniref:Uma2 family endonuclease n=1 Tax=Streptomyces sclerotialus TaxID=1957 RepID=UPI0004C4F61C